MRMTVGDLYSIWRISGRCGRGVAMTQHYAKLAGGVAVRLGQAVIMRSAIGESEHEIRQQPQQKPGLAASNFRRQLKTLSHHNLTVL